MAVAAYAAVVNLMQVLDRILEMHMLHLDRNQIETLREKVSFLQDFLEVHSQRSYEELEGFAMQIAAVAIEADDIIDARVVDQLTTQSGIDLTSFWKSDIDNLIEKIDSIKIELMMIKDGMTIQEQRPGDSDRAHSSAPAMSGNNTTIGFDEQVDRIILELTGDKSDLQVLPIVGMGGIGKSTLAKTVFDDRYLVRHFDVHTWVSISQDYSVKRVLFGLLGEGVDDEKYNESDKSLAELGEQLYKKLYDRRYLVVMDDVWSIEVWDDLRSFFPDNRNGSRIVVTTRLSDVAVSFSTSNPYLMDFLDKDKSWDLFCKKAFPKDGRCPPELEKVGKNIAKSCKGLPLAIVVIGGMLSKSNVSREYWESVAENVNSFANSGDDEHCLNILSLSYNHLPIHLKPCFLYMREFPEDAQIRVDELKLLWDVEGFLKPIKDKTLEEVATAYLEDLFGRSLIFIRERTNRGHMLKCGIHDLLRDLCIKESHREHFYRVPRVQFLSQIGGNRDLHCILCSKKARTRIDLPLVVVSSQPTSITSCSVCDKCRITYPQLNRLRFAKVPGLNNSEEGMILLPTKLRALSCFEGWAVKLVGNSLHLLWNLHALIIVSRLGAFLPSKIWELPQLRRLVITPASVLPNPPITQVDRKDSTIILKNLQKLATVKNVRWSENVIERIPNLKDLGIAYYGPNKDWSYYSLHLIGRLHKLESLFFYADALLTLKNISFPHSLKHLRLERCNIPWEEMTTISSLPNLEVLELSGDAFKGPEWNLIEEKFPQLKGLSIESSDLVHWGAEKIHFPNLEYLRIASMGHLVEIPSGIGEIETLHSIHVSRCKASVVNSAKDILEEQRSFGNENFHLYVYDKFWSVSGVVDHFSSACK